MLSPAPDVVPAVYRMAALRARTVQPRATVALVLFRYVERPHDSVPEIAAEAFVHPRLPSRWARQAGLPVRSTGRDQAPTAEEIDAARDAYVAAGSETSAARMLGIARTTLAARLDAGDVERDDVSAVIRARVAEAYDADDGCVTIGKAADMTGMSHSALRRWCENGRIPGAHRDFAIVGRCLWRVPTAWATERAADVRRSQADTLLPAAPLGRWLLAHADPVDHLAMRAGITDGSRLRQIANGNQDTVGMATADRLLTANDTRLDDVWPYLDDQLALARWAAQHHQHTDGLAEAA